MYKTHPTHSSLEKTKTPKAQYKKRLKIQNEKLEITKISRHQKAKYI